MRTKKHSDHLVFIAYINSMTPEQRKMFDPMTEEAKRKFYGELSLEIAKAKISFYSDATMDQMRIEKGKPITPQLAAADVIELISEIHFSVIIVWRTIENKLGGQPDKPLGGLS